MHSLSILSIFVVIIFQLGLVQADDSNGPLISISDLKDENVRETSVSHSSKDSAPFEKPLVLGHRGACGYLPEHTLASYELAMNMGADFIEFDLVATKDGVLIARHEYEIGETTNVATLFPERKTTKTVDGETKEGWYVEDFTFAEIQTLRAKERLAYRNQSANGKFKIPRFEEIISTCPEGRKELNRRIGIYPEIKHSTYFRSLNRPLKCKTLASKKTINCNIEDKLLEILTQYHYDQPGASPVIIQSFEISNLIELRNKIGKNSRYQLIQLIDEPQMKPGDLMAQAGNRITYKEMLSAKNIGLISKYADIIGPWKRLLVTGKSTESELARAKELVQLAHQHNLLVHLYTFRSDPINLLPEYGGDPSKEYLQFFNLGIDGVFTDSSQDALIARKIYQGKEPIKN